MELWTKTVASCPCMCWLVKKKVRSINKGLPTGPTRHHDHDWQSSRHVRMMSSVVSNSKSSQLPLCHSDKMWEVVELSINHVWHWFMDCQHNNYVVMHFSKWDVTFFLGSAAFILVINLFVNTPPFPSPLFSVCRLRMVPEISEVDSQWPWPAPPAGHLFRFHRLEWKGCM
jgi:hypothetical protein